MAEKRRYFKELRISQLRAMIEIARSKGFADAAEALDLSTPSVWHQIRSLESEFGLGLVEVNGKHVTLTDEGNLLVELAEPVVLGFDSIAERFADRSKSLVQRLSIAAPGNILINELPAPIRRYQSEYPGVELSLVDAPSGIARGMLEEGAVDLAVVGQLGNSCPPSLEADLLTSFPFVLVCPAGHPILKVKRLQPKSLVRFPLVMSSIGTNTRRRVDEVFAHSNLQNSLRIVFETSTKELLLHYVRMEFGITIVPLSPRYRAESDSPYGDISKLEFRDVSRTFGEEQIVILRRRHRYEQSHQRAFREIVLESLDQL